MNTIEKIEKGHFNFSEFSEEQVNFIKGLVKFAYNDGLEDGKYHSTIHKKDGKW